jgi:hypothetical protein
MFDDISPIILRACDGASLVALILCAIRFSLIRSFTTVQGRVLPGIPSPKH